MLQHQKKNKKKSKKIESSKTTKAEIKEIKRKQKQAKMLEKAKKKYGIKPENSKTETIKEEKVNNVKETDNSSKDGLSEKLSKLSKEQQEALLKLLER